ncbi:hypothetical protein THAOC_36962 [Thalassiosira oceanica]|uniref:Uncharacterized protein n=1 Tax=Thalassiosira oceanica TaxID=159749 RepID=K0R715_THAOC|nr:hypothetical protein THAOC_36962 [Thalassiosira oceanica]|eukprot:EJK44491.1 hypothetical protein THAOC_36962 [Thalassiosira oceanica]
MIGFSGRLLTFVLSAYLIQIVTVGVLCITRRPKLALLSLVSIFDPYQVYFKAVRGKARGMMYGLSKAVDILSVALDYDHSSSEACRLDLERALSAIGHYALVVVSTINIPQKAEAKEIRREVFESRKFDGDYFVSLPPKQALHVLRLAVLQAIECERAKGCLAKLTNEQHVALLSYLNDYCGGASSVSSSVTSSKLPFAYVHLVNWGVKILTAFYLVTFECLAAEDWDTTSVCMPWEICKLRESNPTASTWMFFIWVNLMTLAILYFLFGILEVYVCVNDTWQSGLVLQNYEGIIDLICEPLLMKPASIADLSAVYNTSKASIQATGFCLPGLPQLQVRRAGEAVREVSRPATLAEDTVHELQAVAWTPRSSDASARYLTLGEPASTPFELGSGGPTYKQAKGLPRPLRTNCAWSPPGSPPFGTRSKERPWNEESRTETESEEALLHHTQDPRRKARSAVSKPDKATTGAPFRLIFGRMRAQVSYPYSALSQSKRCTSWPAFLEPVLRPQIMAPPRPSITPSLHSTTLRQAYYQADRHRSQREYSYSIHLHRRSSETSLRFASSLKYQMASSAGDKSLSRCKGSRQVRLGDETHQDDARVAEATGERRRQHQT